MDLRARLDEGLDVVHAVESLRDVVRLAADGHGDVTAEHVVEFNALRWIVDAADPGGRPRRHSCNDRATPEDDRGHAGLGGHRNAAGARQDDRAAGVDAHRHPAHGEHRRVRAWIGVNNDSNTKWTPLLHVHRALHADDQPVGLIKGTRRAVPIVEGEVGRSRRLQGVIDAVPVDVHHVGQRRR